jgi:hypothetical protein
MIFLDLCLQRQVMIRLVDPIREIIRFGMKLEINRAEEVGKQCQPLRHRRTKAILTHPVMVAATAAVDIQRQRGPRLAVQQFILSAVLEYPCGDFCL